MNLTQYLPGMVILLGILIATTILGQWLSVYLEDRKEKKKPKDDSQKVIAALLGIRLQQIIQEEERKNTR